jgi:hypothetical protein
MLVPYCIREAIVADQCRWLKLRDDGGVIPNDSRLPGGKLVPRSLASLVY